MLFNSYVFILYFLPVTLVGYYTLNRFKLYTLSKTWLLLASLYFYGYFNFSYLPIIVGSILFNFIINKLLHRYADKRVRLALAAFAVCANVALLLYFKYFDFFVSNMNAVFQTSFNLKHLILPLAISFFTFEQISYVVDSYRKEVPNYNILDYALFVTFIPHLLAGPIVLHSELVPQFADPEKKRFNAESFSKGIMAFIFGLAKKVLVADIVGGVANWGFANITGLDATNSILTVLAYTFQIYFDFSGYCDMATGIGLMFNIVLPANFRSPYRALNINDFWKRWHITLTRFFTTYVYIPLGGNRKGTVRTYLNVFAVFLVSGFWHGANWTFILWGVMHGVFSLITRAFKTKIDKLHPAFNWLTTFLFVNIAWVYFRADSIHSGTRLIRNILSLKFAPIREEISGLFKLPEFTFLTNHVHLLHQAVQAFPMLFLAGYYAFCFFAVLCMKNTNERLETFKPTLANAAVLAVLLVWSVLSLASVSTFLYFNF